MRPVKSLLKNAATLGFIGYMPLAPGTWGAASAFIFIYALGPNAVVHAVLIAAFTVFGVIASDAAEKAIGQKDSEHIIIDEFAGYLVASFYMPHTLKHLAAAFFLFRIFDILKPPPIRNAERSLKGGFGVMADDLLAGLLANAVIQIWITVL